MISVAVAGGWLLLACCATTRSSSLPTEFRIAAYTIALRDAHRHVVAASTIALDVTGDRASSREVDAVQKLIPEHAVRAGHCEPRDERCLELRIEPRARTRRDRTVRIWSIRPSAASWCDYRFTKSRTEWTGVRAGECGGMIGDDFDH